MNKALRILIPSSTYAPAKNGQAVFTTNLAEGLAQRGHAVTVIVDSLHRRESRTTINGVEVVELGSIGLNIFHSDVNFTPFPGFEVRRLINELHPDIIHIQDHFPICRAAVREGRKRGIKIVGSNHFIPENLAPYLPGISKIKPVFNWVLWHWMINTYKYADVISAQSMAATQLTQGQGLGMPIRPISCGIDLSLFKPAPTDRCFYHERYGINSEKTIFLFLGRIDGEKRIDLLIQAMQRLSRDDIQLVIAGKGRAEESIHKMATDLQKNHKIVFTGFVPAEDLQCLMNSVDIFIMPSEAELLSISTLEAMACGLPVIVANALALPELVRQDENGYVFKPGDVDDLVRLMNKMADQPDRWEAMGRVSREIAQYHSLDNTLDKFELLYKQLLGQGSLIELEQSISTPA